MTITKEDIINEWKCDVLNETKKTFARNLKTVKLALKNSFQEANLYVSIKELNKVSKEISIFNLRENINLITNYDWK